MFHSWGWIKPSGMNDNDILGTQNWKQSQADPFLAHKIAIFGRYLYVDNMDENFHPHLNIPHMRIIRMKRIFCIRMANPSRYSSKQNKGFTFSLTLLCYRLVHFLFTISKFAAKPWPKKQVIRCRCKCMGSHFRHAFNIDRWVKWQSFISSYQAAMCTQAP